MSTENEADIPIASRVSKSLYTKIVERQRAAERASGITPSLSAVIRSMLEEAATPSKRRSRR